MRAPIALAALISIGGCTLGPLECATYGVYGLSAVVEDAATGQRIHRKVWAVTVDLLRTYRDSNFADSPAGPTILPSAFERPGTYRVTAGADGYETASVIAVVNMADRCHVEGTAVTLRLRPK